MSNVSEMSRKLIFLVNLTSLFLKVKLIWKSWDLRSFLILSFSLQCILICMASMRKRTSKKRLIYLIWLAYLLADWAAYYAIGLIPAGNTESYNVLHAFWAPFFLLHLGGPNTIAAFSVEDNELWNRSVLHLVVQATMTGFIIYRVLPHNPLLVPTLLVFVSALARYIERVLALYNASMTVFRASVMDENGGNLEPLKHPCRSLSEVELVNDSHRIFLTYRRIIVGMPIKFDDMLRATKVYFLALSTKEAFDEMEIQMNLMYDIFYTKAWLIVEEKAGKFLHSIALFSELGALALWLATDKGKYPSVDIRLTNTLLFGAIAVDVVSAIKLIFSDLMIAHLAAWNLTGQSRVVHFIMNKALRVRNNEWGRLLFRRWSGSISQYNLIQSNVEEGQQEKQYYSLNLLRKVRNVMDTFVGLYVKDARREEVSEVMRNEVLQQLKARALYATNQGKSEEVCLKIGAYVTRMYGWAELDKIFTNAGLVEALLLWHLVTELYYKDQMMPPLTRQLSEYMMYLLVRQPTMIAEGVGIQMMYKSTCKFLGQVYDDTNPSITGEELRKDVLEQVKRTSGDTTMRRSMLKYAHCLKKHLNDYEYKEQAEEVINEIWIELLFHVAIKCRAWAHVKQVSNGGEFLTLVWLMMTYLGLTTNFEPERGDAQPISSQRDQHVLSVSH